MTEQTREHPILFSPPMVEAIEGCTNVSDFVDIPWVWVIGFWAAR